MQNLFLSLKGFSLLNEKLGFFSCWTWIWTFCLPYIFFFLIARHRSSVFLDGILAISNISLKTEGLHLECQLQYRNENKGSGWSHPPVHMGIFPLSLEQILKRLCMWGMRSQGFFLSHLSRPIPLSLAMVISISRLRMCGFHSCVFSPVTLR